MDLETEQFEALLSSTLPEDEEINQQIERANGLNEIPVLNEADYNDQEEENNPKVNQRKRVRFADLNDNDNNENDEIQNEANDINFTTIIPVLPSDQSAINITPATSIDFSYQYRDDVVNDFVNFELVIGGK